MGNNIICNESEKIDKKTPEMAIEIQKLRVYKQFELLIYYQGLTGELKAQFQKSVMDANMEPLDFVF